MQNRCLAVGMCLTMGEVRKETGMAAESGNLEAERWMREALEFARVAQEHGEVPIGAVVVHGGQVIAGAHNWRETWRDGTAHAELIAIREASRKLGAWRLQDCDLYVTLEPCPMCAGAIMLSRIRHLYYGATDRKGGAIESKVSLLSPGLWNHHPEITGGVLAEECGMILQAFFQRLRANQSGKP